MDFLFPVNISPSVSYRVFLLDLEIKHDFEDIRGIKNTIKI